MLPKVAFVIDELEVGGSQRQLYMMAAGLAGRGWQVQVVCLQPVLTMATDFTAAGVPVQLIQKRSKLDLRLVSTLYHFFRREQVTVVHAFSSTAEFFAGLAARLGGSRVVASIRNYNESLPLVHRMGKKLACALASAVVANSQAGAQAAVAAGIVADEKVHVVPNGIESRRPAVAQKEARLCLGVPAEAIVVLSVGRPVWEKGYEVTIEIAKRLAARHSQTLFLIAGDGPLRSVLEQRIQEAGVGERVRLLGERRDVPVLLAAADLYLNTSVSEGLSNSIMEAMAAGVPVLAAAAGGTPELVLDGETGLLFPPRDHALAIEKLDHLISNPGFRLTLGDQGRWSVEARYGLEAMLSRLESLYRLFLPPLRGNPYPRCRLNA
ncbi:MAG: glycosyltransferase [Deltaproteobacteria bacterium]|nr:glycosyltransferase [Deltaproteobacteria bacterium]